MQRQMGWSRFLPKALTSVDRPLKENKPNIDDGRKSKLNGRASLPVSYEGASPVDAGKTTAKVRDTHVRFQLTEQQNDYICEVIATGHYSDNFSSAAQPPHDISSPPTLPKLLRDLPDIDFSSTSSFSVHSKKFQSCINEESLSSNSIDSRASSIPDVFRGSLNGSFSSIPSTSNSSSNWERDPRHKDDMVASDAESQKKLLDLKSDGQMLSSIDAVSRVNSLICKLDCEHIELQRMALVELRMLAKDDNDLRRCIADAGALEPLLGLLHSNDEISQQEATTTLLNLSLNPQIRSEIIRLGAIQPLVMVVREGLTATAMENAAMALVNLAGKDNDIKAKIGVAGAIKPLLELLGNGSERGRKDAATALYCLSSIEANKKRIVRGGATRLLLDFISEDGIKHGMMEKSIAILRNIVSIEEGRVAFVEEGGLKLLLQVIQVGTKKSQELSLLILFQICRHSSKHRTLVLNMDVLSPLLALYRSGTVRLRSQISEVIHVLEEQIMIDGATECLNALMEFGTDTRA